MYEHTYKFYPFFTIAIKLHSWSCMHRYMYVYTPLLSIVALVMTDLDVTLQFVGAKLQSNDCMISNPLHIHLG